MAFGEITTTAVVDYEAVIRQTLREIGYDSEDKGLNCETCEIRLAIEAQSPDIAQAVHEQKALEDIGAGD